MNFTISCSDSDIDSAMESMFKANKKWHFEREITESSLKSKDVVSMSSDEVKSYIVPELKSMVADDLVNGKAVDILVYDDDKKVSYESMKLMYEGSDYVLRDTTQLYDKKGLKVGHKIGFRYEGHFAMLVVKLLE